MEGVIECLVPCICSVSRLRLIHEIKAVLWRRRADFKRDEGRKIMQSRSVFELVLRTTGPQMMCTQLHAE